MDRDLLDAKINYIIELEKLSVKFPGKSSFFDKLKRKKKEEVELGYMGKRMKLLSDAKFFAKQAHIRQMYGPMLYAYHLGDVEDILIDFNYYHIYFRMSAWLHDILEDTSTTLADLQKEFPSEVCDLVWAVTCEKGANRKERFARTLPKIRVSGKNAVILKLADRISNCRNSLLFQREDKFNMYYDEYPFFRGMLYTSGEADAMWTYLDEIMLKKQFVTK